MIRKPLVNNQIPMRKHTKINGKPYKNPMRHDQKTFGKPSNSFEGR